jgi:acetylornithine deacetylase
VTAGPQIPDLAARVSQAAAAHKDEAVRLLADLIRFESTYGNERPVVDFAHDYCREFVEETTLVPFPQGIEQHEDYTFCDAPVPHEGRPNLLLRNPGAGGGPALRSLGEAGRSVILQSHLDVVPAQDWPDAFAARVEGDALYGRGACDAKGPCVSIILALRLLRDLGLRLRGEVQAQLVIEEEVGGNGALAMILQGCRADAAVVCEGSDLQVHPANRGAIWFRLRVTGKSVHMGRAHEGVNAIEKVAALFPALRAYEERLVEQSQGHPLFARYERPVQLNIGMIRAGDWPSTVAGEAVLEGGVGFLPNKPMAAIKQEVREVIESAADEWTRSHYELDFPKLHNDAYEDDPNHPAVQALAAACREAGLGSEVYGWNVSCDARLYHHRGKMPTIVFGPGSISDAHAAGEKISVAQMLGAARALALFLVRWCGVESQ